MSSKFSFRPVGNVSDNAVNSYRNSRPRVTVNAAFLQEIKEVNVDLWDCIVQLRARCAAPISMHRAGATLLGQLESLRDLLGLQFSLEEAYGYFESPAEVAPKFAERVESLRSEHRSLFVMLLAICDDADLLLRTGKLAELTTIIPVAFDEFFQALQSHERRECELVLENACTDIGVGD